MLYLPTVFFAQELVQTRLANNDVIVLIRRLVVLGPAPPANVHPFSPVVKGKREGQPHGHPSLYQPALSRLVEVLPFGDWERLFSGLLQRDRAAFVDEFEQ